MIGGTPNAIFNEIRVASRTRRCSPPSRLRFTCVPSGIVFCVGSKPDFARVLALCLGSQGNGHDDEHRNACACRNGHATPVKASPMGNPRCRNTFPRRTGANPSPAGAGRRQYRTVGVSARWEPTPCPRDLGPRYAALAGSLISRRGGRRRAALKRDRERLRPRPPEPPAGCRARSRG